MSARWYFPANSLPDHPPGRGVPYEEYGSVALFRVIVVRKNSDKGCANISEKFRKGL